MLAGMMLATATTAHTYVGDFVNPDSVSTPLREMLRDKYRTAEAQGVACTMSTPSIDSKAQVDRGSFWSHKAALFNNLTGATVLIDRIDRSDFDIRLTSLADATGPGFYCGYVQQANNLPDMAKHDAVLDLTERVQQHPELDWFDIFPRARDSVSYRPKDHDQASVFGMPIDGDVIMMVYRADLLEIAGFTVPRTWDELATFSEYFAERDINYDGQPDFGVCFTGAHTRFWAIVAPYLQTEGHSQGIFFDMESFLPKSRQPEFVHALRMWKRLMLASSWRDLGHTTPGQTRDLMTEGRCAFYFGYPTEVKVVISSGVPPLVASNQTQRGEPILRLQPHRLPGVACTDIQRVQRAGASAVSSRSVCAEQTATVTSCPFAVDGVNYAPFYAGGGLTASVRKSATAIQQDMAFDFWMFVADPEVSYYDVANPDGGLDPYRNRHVELSNLSSVDAQAFLHFSWSVAQIRSLFAETKFMFDSDNGVRDLSIQGYYSYVHDATMPALYEYLHGEQDEARTQFEITREWQEVTLRYTLQGQRNEYRRTLGLGPYDEASSDSLTLLIYIPPFVVLGFGLLGLLIYAGRRVYCRLKQQAMLAKEQVMVKRKRVRDASNLITSVPFPMVFIGFSDFKRFSRLTPFEETREKGVQLWMNDFEAITCFCRSHPTCFISHQWLGFGEPDADNQHFLAICAAVEQLCETNGIDEEELYLWLDYSCIAQENETLKSLSISAIGMYASVVRYFIAVAPPARHGDLGTICDAETYGKRGWCRLEQWARMTVGGLADMHVFTGDTLDSACLTPMCDFKRHSARTSMSRTSTGSGATEAISDWVTESICVFEGEFAHVEDKAKIVDTVLGLWSIALRNDMRGASAEEARERRVILDAIEANKARVFPAEVFGDLVQVLEQQQQGVRGSRHFPDRSHCGVVGLT